MSCPVLLRQTSFLALSEYIEFTNPEDGSHEAGHHQVRFAWSISPLKSLMSSPHTHQARFGEIEQRGCALTEEGKLNDVEPNGHLLDRLRTDMYDQAVRCTLA